MSVQGEEILVLGAALVGTQQDLVRMLSVYVDLQMKFMTKSNLL